MRSIRELRSLTILALAGLLLLVRPAVAADPRTEILRVLYTNDMHAQLEPVVANWLEGSPRVGGFEALSGLIARLRGERDNVVVVDAGDLLTGPSISTLTRGLAPFDFLDAIGYDAMAIGNHEFDVGVPALERCIWSTSVPVLGANVYWRESGRRFARPYVILDRGGLRVVILGVIGEDAAEVTLPEQVRELEFRDPASELRPLVEALRPEVDVVVVLAHQGKTGPMQSDAEAHPELQRGFDADVSLARAVPGIDVLVGGHAHRGIDPPHREPANGTLVVQTYGHTTTLGVLDLEVARGQGVVGYRGRLERVWSDRERPTAAMSRRVAYWRRELARRAAQPMCVASAAITRSYDGASPLGNLVTDLMRRHTGAEIALYNAGGLRADLPEGTVSYSDVISALPFNNRVELTLLTGEAILAALEQGLSGEHGMIQQSGLEVRFDPARPAGGRVVSVTVAGEPLRGAREYLVATIDFLVQGGDGYVSLSTGTTRNHSSETIGALMAIWLQELGTVAPTRDRRSLPIGE